MESRDELEFWAIFGFWFSPKSEVISTDIIIATNSISIHQFNAELTNESLNLLVVLQRLKKMEK